VIFGAVTFTISRFTCILPTRSTGLFLPDDEVERRRFIHFLSRTGFEHFLKKTGTAYAIFAVSFHRFSSLSPSGIVGSSILKKQSATEGSLLGFEGIAFFSLGMPLRFTS